MIKILYLKELNQMKVIVKYKQEEDIDKHVLIILNGSKQYKIESMMNKKKIKNLYNIQIKNKFMIF